MSCEGLKSSKASLGAEWLGDFPGKRIGSEIQAKIV